MLDLTKPVQTRDGREVRVLCTDTKGATYPVVGLVTDEDGDEEETSWTTGGDFNIDDSGDDTDLINVPERLVAYVNMYPDRRCSAYRDRGAADEMAANTRVARVRVEGVEGQYDE